MEHFGAVAATSLQRYINDDRFIYISFADHVTLVGLLTQWRRQELAQTTLKYHKSHTHTRTHARTRARTHARTRARTREITQNRGKIYTVTKKI